MKKIALDLDGVVFDSENLYRVYTEIYDAEKQKKIKKIQSFFLFKTKSLCTTLYVI